MLGMMVRRPRDTFVTATLADDPRTLPDALDRLEADLSAAAAQRRTKLSDPADDFAVRRDGTLEVLVAETQRLRAHVANVLKFSARSRATAGG